MLQCEGYAAYMYLPVKCFRQMPCHLIDCGYLFLFKWGHLGLCIYGFIGRKSFKHHFLYSLFFLFLELILFHQI